MKFNLYQKKNLPENYLDLYYDRIDDETNAVLTFLNTFHQGILGKLDDKQRMLLPHEIYYCEIVDRKCFAYLKDSVWQIESNIQTLAAQFQQNGFVRIGHSMVVNVHMIDCLKSNLNMKVTILLKNGENVVLNRAYKKSFFQYLDTLKKEKA